MSQNNAIPPLSRPPSSQSTSDGTPNDDEGDAHSSSSRPHDHNRPFPPPRLPLVHAPSRVPLSSSFRSRPSLRTPQNVDSYDVNNTRGLLSDSSPAPVGEVSLTVPRPDVERTINEYVEAPFKHCCNQERRLDKPKVDRRHRHQQKGSADVAPTHRQRSQGFRLTATSTSTTANNPATAAAVTKQPVSFTKEPANALARTYDPAGLSIMCDFCGRCRCESCREPPPLPSKWLCDNKCFCSADTILDYASCLCCVKGLFYHCVDGSSGAIDDEAVGSCADEPCSCTGNRRTSKWACLGALTLVMPCLLCYWPFKGCVALCELCYARHAAQGCRCNPNTVGRHHPIANDIGDSRDPEKRLLDPVTPEL